MPSDALLFLLFTSLQFIDYELTSGIVKRGGRELNPLVRWLIDRLGSWGLRLSKLVAVALGYLLLRYGEAGILAGACVLYVGLITWNWRQLRRARESK